MCRLLEDYLVLKELKTAPHLRSELLVGALERRNDYHLYKETVHKRLRKLDTAEEQGKTAFREAAFLYQSLYYHPETERLDKDSDFLQRHIENLENYLTIACLENGAESLVKKHTVNARERLFFTDTAALAAEKKAGELPVPESFLALYRLLGEEVQAEDFLPIKTKVLGSLKNMDAKEKQMALKLLSSKANSLVKAGHPEQIHMLFDLYKKSVDEGLSLAANGVMDPTHFINVVIAGAKVGEFDWVLQFLQKYKRHLPETEKKIVESLCMGSIYFQQGMKNGQLSDYKTALRFLEPVPQRSHEKYNIRIRSLCLRSRFELFREDGEFEPVDKQMKNFKSYLGKNETLSQEKKDEYSSFLYGFRGLCKLQTNPDKTKATVDQYLKELSGGDKIFLRDWLMSKAEELKSSLRQ